MSDSQKENKILAISSGGGHWIELKRLEPLFAEMNTVFAIVGAETLPEVVQSGRTYYSIPDATRWNKCKLLWLAAKVLYIVLKERPDVIITTGAAPGYFALMFGHYLGCRTVWLDSFANAEELSLSGQKAGRYADLWLTQWPHMAAEGGPFFGGRVI